MNIFTKLLVFSILALGLSTNVYSQKISRIYSLSEDWDPRCRLNLDDNSTWEYKGPGTGIWGFPETWKAGHEVGIMINGHNSSSLKNMDLDETLPVQFTGFCLGGPDIKTITKNSISLSDGRLYLTNNNLNWMPGDVILVGSQNGSRIGDLLFNTTRKATANVNDAEWLKKAHYKIKEVDAKWGDMISLENGTVLQIYNEDLHEKWSEGDSIILLNNHEKTYFGDHHFYHYILLNPKTGTQVLSFIVDADFAYLLTIDGISEEGKLLLSSGDVFQMEMLSGETLSSWNDTDRVIIGVNNGEKNDQYPYLLINVDQSLSGQNRDPAHIILKNAVENDL
ncbi:MAG: hypothetical protein K940chlam7_00537 [Chlamydiae bacterium]|nr:hypothetical protein [Chlamydiota bacterium]